MPFGAFSLMLSVRKGFVMLRNNIGKELFSGKESRR